MLALRRGAIALAVFALAFVWVRWWDFTTPSIGGARYQAVFLSNGATYFGEYHDRFGAYAKIENPYYIETPKNEAGEAGETRLVRRGTELHGPQPRMLIPKDSILFIEDVGAASPIAQFMDKDRK